MKKESTRKKDKCERERQDSSRKEMAIIGMKRKQDHTTKSVSSFTLKSQVLLLLYFLFLSSLALPSSSWRRLQLPENSLPFTFSSTFRVTFKCVVLLLRWNEMQFNREEDFWRTSSSFFVIVLLIPWASSSSPNTSQVQRIRLSFPRLGRSKTFDKVSFKSQNQDRNSMASSLLTTTAENVVYFYSEDPEREERKRKIL